MFCVLEPFWDTFWCPFGTILGAIWDPRATMDSKWLSKGPAREPKEFLEPWEKAGQKIDDLGGSGWLPGAQASWGFLGTS